MRFVKSRLLILLKLYSPHKCAFTMTLFRHKLRKKKHNKVASREKRMYSTVNVKKLLPKRFRLRKNSQILKFIKRNILRIYSNFTKLVLKLIVRRNLLSKLVKSSFSFVISTVHCEIFC
jgi:hypothetical protein